MSASRIRVFYAQRCVQLGPSITVWSFATLSVTTMATERACGQCGALKQPDTWSCFWRGIWYCSRECIHAAGDRSACHRDCGCTRYAKKRRVLRRHRAQMRVMMDLIDDNGLQEELETDMIHETGNTSYWLGDHSDMDEPSDAEDPEAALRKEVSVLRADAADKSALLSAVQGALQCRSVLLDMERARMELEDLRSGVMRSQKATP